MDAPKLEVLTGPLKTAIFAVPESGEVTVGRDHDNLIRITHASVSRHHCVFARRDPASVAVRDLGSRNGTLVNGATISGERLLRPGDEIQVGTSLFVLAGHAGSRSGSVTLKGPSRFLAGQTIDCVPVTAQVVRLLDGLLKSSQLLSAAASYTEWERILLNAAFDLTRAERAAVVAPDSGTDFSNVAGVNREFRETPLSMVLPSGLVARAIRENQAIVDISSNRAPVLIAPIRVLSHTGLVYLEGPGFDDDELHAIAAVATLAGLAWERVAAVERLEAENERLWVRVDHELVGTSSVIERLVKFISKVAATDSSILLLGESGTGKDLAAAAIHRSGSRARKPFVTVNCGAIPGSLIEAELFGAERGAFTGATTLRKGLFEAAAGGTVFLDEVSELPLSAQPALLRVLQNGELRRLGGSRTISVDFRLIAASNRDLEKMVEQGQFRADLYYRLKVISHFIEPLRARSEDVAPLAESFVRKFAARSRPTCRGLTKRALRALTAYSWPGNVRELANAIERAVVMGDSPLIEWEDLPESITDQTAASEARVGGLHEGVTAAKRRLVQEALERDSSFVGAARILKIHPNYLHRLVNNLGLRRVPDYEAEADANAPPRR